jgi:hypothetical protein
MSSNTNIGSRTATASAGSLRSSSLSTPFSVSRPTLLSSWARGFTPPRVDVGSVGVSPPTRRDSAISISAITSGSVLSSLA